METTRNPNPFAAAEQALAEAGIDFTTVDTCSEVCPVCANPLDLARAA
jgi:uncharacterized protein (UPF0212 family)